MTDKPKNPLKIEKWRLAAILKISDTTLRRMLNVHFIEELKKLNYRTTQHFLFRHQLDFMFPEGIDFEEK